MNLKKDVPIYQLKITLDEIRPPVWRRVVVRGDITLLKLHKVIQAVMPWDDYHLHQFIVGDTCYSIPLPDDPLPSDVKNEARIRLSKIAPAEKIKFVYEYDFGDSWFHEILVEKILPPDPSLKHPVCLAGARSSPPEDCGGVSSYFEFLEAITDPNHPEHERMLDWVGRPFDPEMFDLEEANRLLSRIK
ncbi:MAG: plasmid pRiA4b ORF-3 family protein [Methanothrix sp.]|uniref:plasmid pRiA4b ORF-3 family protein n=1 Tax=Methanothrix sp. TaxID=90426 RepID=UPI0032AFC028|nr:plasmid pRiA4b ORF-3 family protein [Methanothrix sp.]